MDSALVSIIVCTYNGEQFLEEQLESVIHQTYPNLEIIISDDNSTDGTKSILKKYEGISNIKINYNEKNIGFIKNFELAVTIACGNYIAFCDQDDVWLPKKIEKLLAAISSYSLVYSDSMLIDEAGKPLHKKLSNFRKMKSTITDSKGFAFFNVVSGHTMMIKKELLNYVLPLPNIYYHDWWIALHAANLKGIIYLDETLTLYRQHDKTITKTLITKKDASRKLQKRYQDYIERLTWLELLKNDKLEKSKRFYQKLYELYSLKGKGTFVVSLFYFLIKNEKELFQFPKKNYLSKLIEIRKMARGEYKK